MSIAVLENFAEGTLLKQVISAQSETGPNFLIAVKLIVPKARNFIILYDPPRKVFGPNPKYKFTFKVVRRPAPKPKQFILYNTESVYLLRAVLIVSIVTFGNT
jgi:hypothetical protein